MTIAEPDSRRAILSVEPLEGRAAPGGWGCWGGGWDGWSNWSGRGSWSGDSQCRSAPDDSCGGGRRHGDGWEGGRNRSDCRRDWSWSDRGCRSDAPPPPATDCPKPPPPCQPAPCQPPPTTISSQLGGIVYQDDNRNGHFEPNEPLLADVTLTLTGTNAAGQAVSVTVTSNANGGYNFTNLDAGTYSVQATPPVGLLTGHSAAGVFGGTPADNAVNGIAVPAGQSSAGYDIGFEVPRPR